MISCSADKSGRVLVVSYSQHVGIRDMNRYFGKIRELLDQVKPGFLLLTDPTYLESMDAACAPQVGAIMDLCNARGMSTVVRVIPDPNKDIGFDLIACFHHDPPVKTQTHASLAEAIKSLRTESTPVDMTLT